MPIGHVKVIVAGHICLDLIPTFEQRQSDIETLLAPGKLVVVGPMMTVTGGAVSNTGLALHCLGLSTRLMGKVGDDLFGRATLDVLRSYDPALADGMIVAEGEASSYTIVVNPPGVDRMFLHCPGPNDTFSVDDMADEQLASARLFHFGYPPLVRRMYLDGGQELETLFRRAKAQGLITSLDMALPDPETEAGRVAWADILARVLPYVDLFLPSLEEILFMLNRERFDQIQHETGSMDVLSQADGRLLSELAEQLLAWGVTIVVFKLGNQGLYLRTTSDVARLSALGGNVLDNPLRWQHRELLTPCFQVEVVGTTGAGDRTIAGFLAGLLHGLGPEDTMTGAVAVGAYSVEKADAARGIPSWSALQRRIQAGWKRRPVTLPLPGWRQGTAKGIWIGPNDTDRTIG
jgi:sugar/nucleoside kinase (ribokinase family)